MPRKAAGPRLYFDATRRQWVIRDRGNFVRTGAGEASRGDAERALAQYITSKYKPAPSSDPLIANVLAAYAVEHAPSTRQQRAIATDIRLLDAFWGDRRLSAITPLTCRQYADSRTQSMGRRGLARLQSAIRYWHKFHDASIIMPAVIKPAPNEPRERWLTRSEAARLLWAARRTPHLARFILIGIYTGSRPGVIKAVDWAWIDVEAGLMRRRAPGEAEIPNKKRPPVKLGRRLAAHMRRWKKTDGGKGHLIRYRGKDIEHIEVTFKARVKDAGLTGKVTPHTLRHTRATWLMQNKVDPWQAAGHLGMSIKMLETVYGHHHPDWQRGAAEV